MQNKLRIDQCRRKIKAGVDFGASELGFCQLIINGFDFPYPLRGTDVEDLRYQEDFDDD